jgi:hypothetical protein
MSLTEETALFLFLGAGKGNSRQMQKPIVLGNAHIGTIRFSYAVLLREWSCGELFNKDQSPIPRGTRLGFFKSYSIPRSLNAKVSWDAVGISTMLMCQLPRFSLIARRAEPAEASASDFTLLFKLCAKRRCVFLPFALFLPFSTAIFVNEASWIGKDDGYVKPESVRM